LLSQKLSIEDAFRVMSASEEQFEKLHLPILVIFSGRTTEHNEEQE
jgi:hypothetical protein